MQMTASWLEDELSAVSAAQAVVSRFVAYLWTILEMLDHLVVVGPICWNDLQRARPVVDGRAGRMNDIDVLCTASIRTFRETALQSEEPHTLKDLPTGLMAYRRQHERLLEYADHEDDLRNRVVERQNSDAYQWALLISTHEQRHVLQIRDIKNHSKYPTR